MLIILAATLVLLSSFTETAAPEYKSASEIFKDLAEFSDAEFEIYKKDLYVDKKSSTKPEHKVLADKIKRMEMKATKLMKPARTFVAGITYHTLVELVTKKSQFKTDQKLQKDFEKLRKDKKACENLLSSYPKLKRGIC
ncbi:unnamed protein product [Cylicocyclus nassatus]|uniref:Uncharacterized protein n=1 Tax=Cylicocyclus nassatus TaxID=53992 RepID=A0AA36DJP5_CYLNA|nr:unnamed protein product [Cylicocyclus nassatus]